MGINYNKSHIYTDGIRNATYDFNSTSLLSVLSFPLIDLPRLPFKVSCTFQFMVDKPLVENKILFIYAYWEDTRPSMGSGAETSYTNPLKTNWAIVNRNGYLYIYLHEANGVNSLVFKSTNRVLNTLRRKHFALRYNATTHAMELLVDSMLEPLVLDTSNGNYRANINLFTTLQDVAGAGYFVGGGSAYFPTQYSEHSIFYDSYIDRALTDHEINLKYQVIQDTRELPPVNVGKILVASDRGGVSLGYDIYQVNGDFTDPTLHTGLAPGDMYYPSWSKNWAVDDFVFTHQYFAKLFKTVGGISLLSDYTDPAQGAVGAYFSQAQSSPSLGSDGIIFGSTFVPYGNNELYKTDVSNTANSHLYISAPRPLFSSVSGLGYQGIQIVDRHPTNPDLLLVILKGNSFGYRLGIYNVVLDTFSTLYETSYSSAAAGNNPYRLWACKWNRDATRIGFETALNLNGTNYHSYIMNADGSNLIDLGLDTYFFGFSSLASIWDKTVTFSRPLVSLEIIHCTINSTPLSDTPFNTDMATTLADLKVKLLLVLGIDTVDIIGNTIRIKTIIDHDLDINLTITGDVTAITAITTVNTFGVDTKVLIGKLEYSSTYSTSYYRIYERNMRTLAEVNLSGDVPYNDYSCDWKL